MKMENEWRTFCLLNQIAIRLRILWEKQTICKLVIHKIDIKSNLKISIHEKMCKFDMTAKNRKFPFMLPFKKYWAYYHKIGVVCLMFVFNSINGEIPLVVLLYIFIYVNVNIMWMVCIACMKRLYQSFLVVVTNSI